MKIVAILEDSITVGGGFNQALNAIFQMKRICNGTFEFEVYTTHSNNIKYLGEFGVNAVFFKYSILDKLIAMSFSSPLCQLILKRLKIIGPFEAKLLKRGAGLAYFLTQSSSSYGLRKLNYITTVFDLCHRDTPEFPEVRNYGEFHIREQHFKNNLAPALIVLTASDQLSNLISTRYGVDRNRLLSMPFAPAPYLKADFAIDKSAVLSKYELAEGYFFYPSQFWAHKNHIRILEALLILRNNGHIFKVVFVGGDQGNLTHVERFVADHSLGKQVRILGFVPAEHMQGLYEGCTAVTMPTYFGPTNLPPLEAWMLGKPLIYSSHLINEVGDAAICVNPDEPEELAAAMMACVESRIRFNLVEAGYIRLKEVEQNRIDAEYKLKNILMQFLKRRRCWN